MTLQEAHNATHVINSIRLEYRSPSGRNGIWVLVEGDGDVSLFKKLLSAADLRVNSVPGGVDQLRIAVGHSDMQAMGRVIGIRDADFLHLDGKTESVNNLFLTDFHDAEMMLAANDEAFHALVCEHLPRRSSASQDVRGELLESLKFLGGLRWLNDTEDLSLNFRGLSLGKFFDGGNLQLDEAECLDDVHARSPGKRCRVSIAEVSAKLVGVDDLLDLCNGHDFEKAFAAHAKTQSKRKAIKSNVVGSSLRLAYGLEHFQQTELYGTLMRWQETSSHRLFA